MQTIEQIRTGLVANLGDLRMHSICLYITDLIQRAKPEVTVPTYRITNVTSGITIQSIDQFKAAIVAATLKQSYPYQGEKLSNDRVVGYNLVPTNLQVRFNIHSEEDLLFAQHQNYFSDFGSVYNFSFLMAYMNDGDSVIPVKISSVRLIKAL